MSRRPQGYATISDPRFGRVSEMDTFSCCHCNQVIHMHTKEGVRKPPEKSGGWCGQCAKPTCNDAACNKECVPFEKAITQAENKQYQRSQLMRSAGLE